MPHRSIAQGGSARVVVLSLLLGIVTVAAPQLHSAALPKGPVPVGNRNAAELPGLHNVFHLSEKLYGGSVPEGAPGLQSLRRLGVKTLISLDGARPDVDRARKLGMRYVHIPFGYDGCPLCTSNRLVRAIRDLPGPIYLHCHHGKHRSPAAAAFARIALDGISNEEAIQEMERAGTGKNYVGLYGGVRAYQPPTKADLDRVTPDFPEVARTPRLMEAMVQIDHRFEGLMLCQKEGWRVPREHPDLLPAHEALQLRELFTELNRTPDVERRPAEFRQWMQDAQANTQAVEDALRSGNRGRASRFLGQVVASCGTCHARYRNVPQADGS
jgi:protein tyrosine phosphatase (PTP) superfamily phosphohydrolase (DUF442 family)